jgi:hypothetical protein
MDADTGRIPAATLTASDVADASQVGALLDQVTAPVASFTADGAYDKDGVYGDVATRHLEAAVIVPPRSNAILSGAAETAASQRAFRARGDFRTVVARGRMLPSVRSLMRRRTSNPIVLACPTDASSSGWSASPLWHVDAVGARVHPINAIRNIWTGRPFWT